MKQTGWLGNYGKDIRTTQAVRSTSCGRSKRSAATSKLQRNFNYQNSKYRRGIYLSLSVRISLNIGVWTLELYSHRQTRLSVLAQFDSIGRWPSIARCSQNLSEPSHRSLSAAVPSELPATN